jgi:hypothetical protein
VERENEYFLLARGGLFRIELPIRCATIRDSTRAGHSIGKLQAFFCDLVAKNFLLRALSIFELDNRR